MFPDINKIMKHAEEANQQAEIRHKEIQEQNDVIIGLLSDILEELRDDKAAPDVQSEAARAPE